MKIAIDATRAVTEQAGIGRYAFEIIKHLIEIDRQNEYLVFSTHFRDSSQKTVKLNSFKASNVKIKRLKIPGAFKEYLWGRKLGYLTSFLEGSDVLFAPSFFEVNLGLLIPQVVTIHDMTTFLFPDQRGREASKRLSVRTEAVCKKAQKIICVSGSTKKDLVKITGLNKEKTIVIYPGLKKFDKIAKDLPAGLRGNGYVLCVGTLEPRKNLIGLLRAYSLLPTELKTQFPLAIVGGKGWNDSEIYLELEKRSLKNHLVFTGFVSDAVLARLYKDCRVFAYPSFYEGFGLPIIEVQSFQVAVLTSNVSSLPEAGGEGALYVDPDDSNEIAKGLEKLLQDDNLRRSLCKKAFSNSRKFSWEAAAKQTLSILEQACDKN
jgi:glycosyltransferase involved in cell wall biosynthesis